MPSQSASHPAPDDEVQQALRAANERLEALIEASPLAITVVAEDGTVRLWNPAAERMFGWTRQEVLGAPAPWLASEHRPEILTNIQASLHGRPLRGAEALRRRKTGELIHISLSTAPLRDAAGVPRWVLAVVDDITMRKRHEAERAELLAREQARRREAEAFAEASHILTQGLDLAVVAQRMTDHARALLGAIVSTLYMVEEGSGDLVSIATSGDVGPRFRAGHRLERGTGAAGVAVAERRVVTSPNVLEDPEVTFAPEARAAIEAGPHRAALAVPLLVKDVPIGVLGLGDRPGRIFTAEDVRLAQAFADHTAVALENVRLYDEARRGRRIAERAAQRSALLAEASRLLSSSLDHHAALRDLVNLLVPALADWCVIHLATRDGGVQRIDADYADPDKAALSAALQTLARRLRWPDDAAPAVEALRSGRTLFVPEVTPQWIRATLRDPEYRRLIGGLGPRALISVPLGARGRTLGAITLVVTAPGRRYDEDDVELAEDIAARTALAIDNARLYREAQRARTEAETAARMLRHVQAITDTALAHQDRDELLRELLARVRAVLAGDTATILLTTQTGTRLVPVASDGLREEIEERVEIPLGAGIAGRIAASETGLIFDDVSRVGDVRSAFLRERVKSLVGVPLTLEGRVIGALHVGSVHPRRFTGLDLQLLRLVADRIAVAIERVRLHDAEHAARAEAEAANRAKDDFLAVLSHELRTPLTAMLGWVRVLRTATLSPEKVQHALETIERNTRMQGRLIDDLLDVSRIIAGKLALECQPIDAAPLVEETLEAMRREAESRQVRLHAELEAAGARLYADPVRFKQIVVNLVSNALKFTPAGGVIEVAMAVDADELVLSVTDTGAGIEAHLLPHIFDRFRQAEGAMTRRHSGLGLGLAIVRHLAELHGGRVEAHSAGAGKGATFVVRLPVLGVGAPERRENPPAAPAIDAVGLDGVRVLLVEDHADSARLVAEVLAARGAAVQEASTVAEAYERLTAPGGIDVIVSDIGMPDGDGCELLRRYRAWEAAHERPRVPAIALTAFVTPDDRERAYAAGFDTHAPKPIVPEDLVRVVVRQVPRGTGLATTEE